MYFEALVTMEMALCGLLLVAAVRWLLEVAPTPEVDLGRRAWVAARFGMAEAEALGPLFRHLARASRAALREAHRLQHAIGGERERWVPAGGPLAPLLLRWQGVRVQRSPELAELAHLVEQLEQMTRGIARYRAGTGMLSDLRVPLRCIESHACQRRSA